jgi:alkyl sulfatase BDS1-like metallo-beta-lactamase superfamily hydrolase
MGGADRVIQMGKAAVDHGDYRWAAQLLNDVVMADANNSGAKNLLATAYTEMAYRSENATWRDIYLTGAKELREGVSGKNFMSGGAALMANVPTDQLFDLLAVRLDPAKAKDTKLAIRVQFPERHEDGLVTVRNDVLRYEPFTGQKIDATLSLPRAAFMPILGRAAGPPVASNVTITGDKAMVERLYSLFSMPDPAFPVVTR